MAGKGFIEPPAEDDAPPTRIEREDDRDWDALYPEQIPKRPTRKGRGGGARPVGKQTTPEELAARLAERFPAWEKELQGLTVLARRFGPCPGWLEAADILCKRSSKGLTGVLRAALREGPLTADLLWDALHFEAYRDGVDGLTGRVGNAYRALLSGGDVSEFAKHNWLLKYDEAAAVYRLIRAQRTVARALPAVYREAPELIRRGLRHGEYARPLALLEAARWAATEPRSFHAKPLRYFVLRPGDAAWWPAWSLALQIDPAGAAALLAHCQVDPFTATPADLVPGELHRFTLTAEEVALTAESDPVVQSALEQLFGDACRTRPEVMRAAVRHSMPFVRRKASDHVWQVEPAEYEPLLFDPEPGVREYAAHALVAAAGPDWKERPRAGAVLAKALAWPDAAVRRDALQLLIQIFDRGYDVRPWRKSRSALTAALTATLAGPHDADAAAAASVLWQVAKSDAIPALRELLKSEALPRRIAAALALWRLKERPDAAVPVLARAVAEGATDDVRCEAVAALGDFGAAAAPALPAMIAALGDLTCRAAAARSLVRLGPHGEAAVPALVRGFTTDAAYFYRAEVGRALRSVRPAVLFPHLPELIQFGSKYSSIEEGRQAAELLRPFTERTAEAARAELRDLPGTAARLRGDVHYLEEGLPRLVGLAIDAAGSTPGRQALEILNALGANACPAVAALTHALDAADPGLRDDAAGLLEELGRLAAGLMPRVLASLRDAREETRYAAAAVLQWVGPVAAASRWTEEAK